MTLNGQNGSFNLTRTNPREWSLDRILVIMTLLGALITGSAFLLNLNTKVDRLTNKLDNVSEVKERVIRLETLIETMQENIIMDRRSRIQYERSQGYSDQERETDTERVKTND